MNLQSDVGEGFELLSQMMNKPDTTGGSFPSPMIYCGRCGRPKQYVSDYWGQTHVYPRCDCPPIETYGEGEVYRSSPAQGWECPKCKRILAPHVDECKDCNNVRLVSITRINDYEIGDDLSTPNMYSDIEDEL